MPLAFVTTPKNVKAITLNKQEKNLASYITSLETDNSSEVNDYAIAVNIEIKFSRSKASDALSVQLTNDPAAPKLHLSEEQVKDKYPLNYASLTEECRKRYSNFVLNKTYHRHRAPLKSDKKYCLVRRLDQDNPRSAKQEWYSRAIYSELDKHYKKRS